MMDCLDEVRAAMGPDPVLAGNADPVREIPRAPHENMNALARYAREHAPARLTELKGSDPFFKTLLTS